MGLRDVLRDLAGLGYRTTWGIFSASEVGAPHQRKRVFVMAYDQSLGIQGRWPSRIEEPRPHAGQELPLRGGDAGGSGTAQAWPSRPGDPQHGWEPPRVVGDATQRQSWQPEAWDGRQGIVRGSESVGQPASPRLQDWRGIPLAGCQPKPQLERSEQRQTKPSLGRNAYGPASRVDYAELCRSCDNRTDELRLLGNGVVPATAELAFRTLLEELTA